LSLELITVFSENQGPRLYGYSKNKILFSNSNPSKNEYYIFNTENKSVDQLSGMILRELDNSEIYYKVEDWDRLRKLSLENNESTLVSFDIGMIDGVDVDCRDNEYIRSLNSNYLMVGYMSKDGRSIDGLFELIDFTDEENRTEVKKAQFLYSFPESNFKVSEEAGKSYREFTFSNSTGFLQSKLILQNNRFIAYEYSENKDSSHDAFWSKPMVSLYCEIQKDFFEIAFQEKKMTYNFLHHKVKCDNFSGEFNSEQNIF
jgi:hypothetical protein